MKKITHFKHYLSFGLFCFVCSMAPASHPFDAQTAITVKAASADDNQLNIKLNVQKLSLTMDKSYNLNVYNASDSHKISYKSGNPSVASVTSAGEITGKKVGNAAIIVTVKDGFKVVSTLTCEVTVGPPAISVKFTKDTIEIEEGKKLSLSTILKPGNTTETSRYSSNDPNIVTISPSGRIQAISAGETYVYAEIGSDDTYKYDSCTIIVVAAPSKSEAKSETK